MTKTVLITGASKGIGLCCALGLKARGYRVLATARQPGDLIALQSQGLEVLSLDLNDSASIRALVQEVQALTSGNLYALINNAGYGQPGAVEDLSRDLIRTQFETNVFGPIELTNLLIPLFRAQGSGRIINISSILGMVTLPYRGAYNASKFALEGFTDTLRQELHNTPIQVSLIEPGPIESQFRANAYKIYTQTIEKDVSPHRNQYEKMAQHLQPSASQSKVPFTLPPTAVLQKVLKALESPHPKARYYVTLPAYFLSILKRLLPTMALDWVVQKISAGETK